MKTPNFTYHDFLISRENENGVELSSVHKSELRISFPSVFPSFSRESKVTERRFSKDDRPRQRGTTCSSLFLLLFFFASANYLTLPKELAVTQTLVMN